MLTGNKGEWSEIYTLLKLLGDTVLYPGNEDIERIPNIIYPIIRILRSESNGNFEYSVEDNIVIVSGNEEVLKIPISKFKAKSTALLNHIKTSSSRTFAVPEIEKFMQEINCISLKASSSTKTDITVVIHDQRTNQRPTLGFSIKSQLGSPSTLLNAGKTTNFIFKIEGELNEAEIQRINSITVKRGKKESADLRGRIKAIYSNDCKLNFYRPERQIFSNNLILIDSKLPEILSQIVFEYYSSEKSNIIDLVAKTTAKNPLNFDISNEHQFYEYKIKRFLTDVALGMMPSKVWTGQYDATGGYLIVKKDGDVLCYHIYNRNDFENYLINNTKLETASSSRHGFGELYEENGELFFKLNLQIRFIK